MGVRHGEAFRDEKHADGERGDGDQQAAKHGGGQQLASGQSINEESDILFHCNIQQFEIAPQIPTDVIGKATGPEIHREGGDVLPADTFEAPHRAGHVKCAGHQHPVFLRTWSRQLKAQSSIFCRITGFALKDKAFRIEALLSEKLLGDINSGLVGAHKIAQIAATSGKQELGIPNASTTNARLRRSRAGRQIHRRADDLH
jgi:hypothetical protein